MCILIPLQYHIMPGLSMRYATAGRTGAVNCTEEEEDLAFCPGSFRPAIDRYVRKIGRPRAEWVSKLYEHVAALAAQSPLKTPVQLLNHKLEFERRLNASMTA